MRKEKERAKQIKEEEICGTGYYLINYDRGD